MNKGYTIGMFAKKTRTTIRALRYYDEIGILLPEVSESGRRIYFDKHLVTLQKILTLKFLGYSLDEIKDLLDDATWDISESLALQRELMIQKQEQINRIIKALDHALHIVKGGATINPSIFITIINSIQEEDEHKNWLKALLPEDKVEKLYSITEQQKLDIEKKYAEYMGEIKQLFGKPPEDVIVQHTVHKLIELVTEIMGEDLQSILELELDLDIKEDPMPNPLSNEEEEWLGRAIEIYVQKLNRD